MSVSGPAVADYDITAIGTLAGHTDITTTQKYIHRSIDNLREIANKQKGKVYPRSIRNKKRKQ
jgi:site-specific recombinase XerD